MDLKLEGLVLKHNKIAMDLLKVKNFQDSLKHLQKSKSILEQLKTSPKWLKLLGITLNNIACYYRARKQFKVALKYLQKALKAELKGQEDAVSVSSTLINISALYSSIENHQEAFTYAQRALKILQKNQSASGTNHYTSLSVSYYNAGVQLQHLLKLQKAAQYYQKGIEIAEQSLQNTHPILTALKMASEQLKHRVMNLEDMKGARQYWRTFNRVSPHKVRKTPLLPSRGKTVSQSGSRSRRGVRALRSSLPPIQNSTKMPGGVR